MASLVVFRSSKDEKQKLAQMFRVADTGHLRNRKKTEKTI